MQEKNFLLLNVRRCLQRRTSSSPLASHVVTRSLISHSPPPIPTPPIAPKAPVPLNEQPAVILSREAFKSSKSSTAAPSTNSLTGAKRNSANEDSGTLNITDFLFDVLFGNTEPGGAPPQKATLSYCSARDVLPNLPDSALYLVGRTESFLKNLAATSPARHPREHKSLSISRAMQQLEQSVCEAAVLYRKREGSLEVAAQHTVKHFLLDTSFIRSLLEQAFLSLYYCEDHHRASPSCNTDDKTAPKYALLFGDNMYADYPAPLRSQLEDALRILLCGSPFSFHTTFEQCIRGASRYPYRSTLALEVFMLWWYCNADVLPVELGITSTTGRVCVPNFYGTKYNTVNNQYGIQSEETASVHHHHHHREEKIPLADEALDVAIDHLLSQRNGAGTASSPTCAVLSEGGFLHTHLLLPPPYRHAIRDLAERVPFKKYHVTCGLLPRVIQVAAGLPPSARQRGVSILTQLCAWCCMTLCGTAVKQDNVCAASAPPPPSFNPFAEGPTEWVMLCCTMCAVARIEASRTALTLSFSGASPTESLEKVQEDYIKTVATLCAVATQGDDSLLTAASLNGAAPLDESGLMWAHKLFHVIYQCFSKCGYLDRIAVTQPLPHEKRAFLYYTLFTEVTQAFPHIFHGGATVSTLWAMCCIDNMASVPHSSVARETTLLAWKRAVFASESKTSVERPEESKKESESKGKSESSRSFFSAVDAMAAQEQEAAVLCGRLMPAKADQRSIAPLLAAAPLSAGVSASPLVTVERTRAAALGLFRQHAQLPLLQLSGGALQAPPLSATRFSAQDTRAVREDTVIRSAQPPSFYTWVSVMRLYAQLGDPATVASADGHLMACLEKDIFPHCRPMMANYLRKVGLQSLLHGGQAGVLAMITRFNNEVDRLPPGLAWSYMLQGALWSCLPATADLSQSVGTTTVPRSGDLSCFGRGSLAWKLLEQNRKDLLAPPTRTEANAAEINIRSVFTFLESLALSLPQDAKQIVFLLPQVKQMTRCLTLESQSVAVEEKEDGEQLCAGSPAPKLQPGGVLAEEEYGYDHDNDGGIDHHILVAAEENWDSEEDTFCLTEDDLLVSGATINSHSSTTARVRRSPTLPEHANGDGGAENQTEEDHGARESGNAAAEEAAKELQQAFSWSPVAAQHVLFSMLDVCYWISAAEETVAHPCVADGSAELKTSATLCFHYEQLSSFFSCVLFAKDEVLTHAARSRLLEPPFLHQMCLILLGSCPEVYLLGQCLLLLLKRYLAEARVNPKVVFNRLFRLEEPMCQLLLFHGITLTRVRAWRSGASMWLPEELFNSGLRVLEKASRANSSHMQREELLLLCGSFALLSLEQRATVPATVLEKAKSDTAYAQDVLPSLQKLQTYSYHVQAFLAGGGTLSRQQTKRDVISPALQVILPSRQLLTNGNGRFVKSMKGVLPRQRHPHQKDVHRVRDNRDASRSQTLHKLRHTLHGRKETSSHQNIGMEDDFHSLIFEDEETAISNLFGGHENEQKKE